MRILLVDDEPTVLRGFMRMLRSVPGAEVRAAASVDEAIAILADWLPTVVMSDYSMPHRNGDELLRLLAEKHPQIRRVLVSGTPRAPGDLAHAFVEKPASAATLLRALAIPSR